jgi:hypothetical protein
MRGPQRRAVASDHDRTAMPSQGARERAVHALAEVGAALLSGVVKLDRAAAGGARGAQGLLRQPGMQPRRAPFAQARREPRLHPPRHRGAREHDHRDIKGRSGAQGVPVGRRESKAGAAAT